MQNLQRVYETMEGPTKDLKVDLPRSILVFLPCFRTTIF